MSATVVTPLAVTGAAHLTDQASDVANTASDDSTGLTTQQQIKPLAEAAPAVGVDSDVAAGAAAVKEIESETPFSMVGVTWPGYRPEVVAHVRAKQPDGSWGQWFETESMDVELDEPKTDKGGTEPIYLGVDTTAVQIAIEGVDPSETSLDTAASPAQGSPAPASAPGEQPAPAENDAPVVPATPAGPAESAPAGPDVAAPAASPAAPAPDAAAPAPFVPPAPVGYADIKPVAEASDMATDQVSAVLLTPDDTPTPPAEEFEDIAAKGKTGETGNIAAKQPSIITRKGWGADESMRCSSPQYDDSLAAATVHHTAGSNNYTKEQSAGIVRGIYTYHAVNLGWCDVGYAFLVDKYGQAFEGRAGGMSKNVQGAHAGGFNANTFGISMMGDYSSIAPPDVTIQKVGQIIGWRLAIAGVDPKGKDQHVSEGTSYSKYAQGTRVTLPNIFAHRDVGTTTCPGDSGYSKMNRIRDIAAAYAKGDGGATGGTPGGGTSGNNGAGTPDSTTPLDPSAVQQQLADALKTLLKGGRLDPGSVSSLLGNGVTLKDLQVDPASAKNGLGTLQQLAARLSPQLGKALSGLQRYGNVSYAKFENGAVYEGPQTGAHAVWGRLGDAWAAQGFEHGPLGLPTAEEEQRPDGTVAQRFEHGSLVFDPATGQVTPAG